MKEKILIVDDDKSICLLQYNFWKRRDLPVTQLEEGIEAFKKVLQKE